MHPQDNAGVNADAQTITKQMKNFTAELRCGKYEFSRDQG